MKQENKDLLLKDLCARFSYGIKVYRKWVAPLSGSPEETVADFSIFDIEVLSSPYNWCSTEKGPREVRGYEVKPYLFPLSSMTEEQKMFLRQQNWCIAISTSGTIETTIEGFDWLNKNHFDYRGLIPMGLAINATGLNIYKK